MDTPISNIQTALSNLDFYFNQSEGSAVYFIEDVQKQNDLSPKVAIDLDKAKVFQADAVYFRFFDSDRLPIPQIYIYDNSSHNFSDDYYAELHRDIWSASEIPMFMVIERASIKIYDSRKPVTVKANIISTTPIRIISIGNLSESNKALKKYNARLFDNGSFWESSEAGKHFLNNHTVYERLIVGLKGIRQLFRANSGIDCSLTDQVLILSILIKYLEENGLDEDGVNLAQKFFKEEVGYSLFIDIIQNKKLPLLFDKLADHFGDIFKLSDTQKETLDRAQLDVLVKFFEGQLGEHLQTVLWAEYSFKFIPVELISNFYEEFLPKEISPNGKTEKKKDTGAVYTPSFLVNFLESV